MNSERRWTVGADEYSTSTDMLIGLIESVRDQIPEIKSYDKELYDLACQIEFIKENALPDFNWISKSFSAIDNDVDTVNTNLSQLKGRLDMEVNDLIESIDTSKFEAKVETDSLNQKVSDLVTIHESDRNTLTEEIYSLKKRVFHDLQETSLKICELNKDYRKDDETLQTKIDEQYTQLKSKIEKSINESDTTISDAIVYFNSIKEKVDGLNYDKDIQTVNESVDKVEGLVNTLNQKINTLQESFQGLQGSQELLQEGLLNIPPDVDNSDPLTPLDQLQPTIEGLQKSYRLFVNRVQEQLATLGGGGAVWLWDLDDVNIGTPTNNKYPIIQDNDVLKFDSATSKWVAGPVTSVGSSDLPLSGGTMTGDINFNAGQQFPGTLELAGGTMTGEIGFTTQQTFPGTLPLTGGAITGDTTYTGSTAGTTNLQTKTSVNALISAAVTDGFVFKGTTDVTGAAPTPAAGDFYINTVAGTASASWTGIATLTISADQLVIYSGAESRWFAGAVEDNTSFLAKTGGTMTGDIVFAGTQTFPSSITSGFLQKSGGTMTGTLITDEIQVPLGKTLTIKRGNSNTSSSGLDIKGYQPGQFNTQTDIFGVSYGNGTSTGDSINYKGRTDGTNNIQTKGAVDAAISAAISADGNLLNGGIISASGGTANNSGNLTLQQENGSGDTSGTLFIKKYNTTDPTITLDPAGKITIDNDSISQIYLQGSGGGKFSVDNNRTFRFSDQLNDFMTLNAADLTLLSPAKFTGSTFVVERGLPASSNATNFVLKGMLSSSIGTLTSTLVSIKRSSGVGDTLQYFGSTTTNNNTVQTKASTEALITANSITPGTPTFQNQASNTGSTLTGFFLCDYSVNSDGMVYLLVSAKDDDNIAVGDVVCQLPAGYRPGSADNTGNGYSPVFTLVNSGTNPTITAQCMVKTDGSITFIQVGGDSQNFYGQCVFSTYDPD